MKIGNFLKKKNSGSKIGKNIDKSFSLSEKAARDWKILLLTFIALGIAAALFDGYVFYKIDNGTFLKTSPATEDSFIVSQKRSVSGVVDLFEAKNAELEKFRNALPAEIDPSL